MVQICFKHYFQIFNASKELNESSQYRNIRLFTVAMKESPTPLYDLEGVAEEWSLPNASKYSGLPSVVSGMRII